MEKYRPTQIFETISLRFYISAQRHVFLKDKLLQIKYIVAKVRQNQANAYIIFLL